MSVDTRTRIDQERAPLDPTKFLDDELPARFADAADRLAAATAMLAPGR